MSASHVTIKTPDTSWNHWVASSTRCISVLFSFLDAPSFSVCLRTWLSFAKQLCLLRILKHQWSGHLHFHVFEANISIFGYVTKRGYWPQWVYAVRDTVSYVGHHLKGFMPSLLIVVHSFRVAATHWWMHATMHAYVACIVACICGNVPIMDMFRMRMFSSFCF